MSYIEEVDKLIDAGELKRAKDICDRYERDEEAQLRIAKIYYLEGKVGLAESLCKKYPNNSEFEKFLITVLTKEGKFDFVKYYEALEICYRYMHNDQIVKSQFVKILIKMERYDEVEKICLEEKDDETFISQLIKSYIKQGKYEKARNLCEKRLDVLAIKSQYITVLIAEGNKEKAKEICRANPDNVVLQSQLITMLMNENKFEEAKEIALKHVESSVVSRQLKKINKYLNSRMTTVKDYYKNTEAKEEKDVSVEEKKIDEKQEEIKEERKDRRDRKDKKNKNSNEVPYIDIIKTKIYMDDIPREYIEDLKKSDLDPWQKSVAIIAIYKKKNETKNAELALKEAKRLFKTDPVKLKKLNSLVSYVSSNKQKMFDWNAFDRIINWEINEDYATSIRLRREEDKLIGEEQLVKVEKEENKIDEKQEEIKEQLKEEVQKQVEEKVDEKEETVKQESKEIVIEGLQQVAVIDLKKEEKTENIESKKEESVKEEKVEEVKEEAKQEQVQQTKKVKKNKNKEKGKHKKEQDLENKMMVDVYKTEIMKLKSKIANSNNIKEFYVVDNIEEKPATDLRAKMQIVMYLRKYGLDKVALEGFPQEYEIYDLINKMMMYKRADSKYDDSKILEEIMEKASKIEGNNEYIYKLLDDVTKKSGEQR